MKKVMQHLKLYSVYYGLALAFFAVGILTTLSVDAMRYTKYVEPTMVEMDPRVAYQEMSANPDGYLFFDVRSIGEYNNLHAALSTSFPIANLYDQWRTLSRSSDKKIYLICSSGRLAGVAYGYLQLHGFRNLVHITGGVQNWTNLGVPVVAKPVFPDRNFTADKPIQVSATTTFVK
jgi:rhodanese-related sulfurtransferase